MLRLPYYFLSIAFLFVIATNGNTALCGSSSSSSKAINNTSVLAKAQSEFANGAWDSAITLYKKHLRSVPSDYTAWNQLSASYYHSGQITLALRTLRKVANTSPDRSFNYFYQGMCLAVLGLENEANKYWQYASNWTDEFGARATFEMGLSAYNSTDNTRSGQLLSLYLQKFPKGSDAESAKTLLKSITAGTKIEDVKGFERPDREAEIYKYHRWSLFQIPHFWMVQLGSQNSESSGYEPKSDKTIDKVSTADGIIQVIASIGLGPNRNKGYTSFAGYTYKQNWITEANAFPDWVANGFSLESFPMNGDFLERSHQFFGDFRRSIGSQFFFGSYARLEFTRVGSTFFPNADPSSLKVVTSEKDTQLLIPWAGYAWSATSRSMLSLYLRKEIHNESLEHSNKTFDLTGSSGQPAISLNLSHAQDFPTKKIEATLDAFQYEFIYNDFWLDYTRQGFVAAADLTIYNKFGGEALVGLYRDHYKVPHIKTGSCKSSSIEESDAAPPHVACTRSDSGSMFQLGLYYQKSQFLRFSLGGLFIENGSNMKVFSSSKKIYQGSVLWAFPGTKRVSKMTGRFADAAFTKDSLE